MSELASSVQFDDVGMIDDLEDSDLAFHRFGLGFTFEIIFLFFILGLLIILTATWTSSQIVFGLCMDVKLPLTLA